MQSLSSLKLTATRSKRKARGNGVKRKNAFANRLAKRRRKELKISLNLDYVNDANLPKDILSKLSFKQQESIPESEKKKFFQICQELQAIKKDGVTPNPSFKGKRGRTKRRNRRPTYQEDESEQAICEFCHLPSTLRISGKSYLVASKTQPNLKICNACKSYEYRHGKLVTREERRRQGRNQRNKTRARSLRLQREAAARKEEEENKGPQPGTIYFTEEELKTEEAPLVLTPLNFQFPEPPNKVQHYREEDNVESPMCFPPHSLQQFLRNINTPTEGYPPLRNMTNVTGNMEEAPREKPYFTFPPIVDEAELSPNLLSSDTDSDSLFFANDDTDSGSVGSDFLCDAASPTVGECLGLDTLPPLPAFTPRTLQAISQATYVTCCECSEPMIDECNLVLCMECDMIFHKKCFKNAGKLNICDKQEPAMIRCVDHAKGCPKMPLFVPSPRITNSPRSRITKDTFVQSLRMVEA